MYLHYFQLKDFPFAVTPDPTFLFLSEHHREALGHLLYGTGESGGFVQLTGEVGTGKTTLIRALLQQEHDNLDVALCLNPQLTVNEFVAQICDELGAKRPKRAGTTLKALVDALNEHLLATHADGRRTVLIVDEAQNLDRDVLEQLRLLTNLETSKHKLLRIILVGQPELEELLRRPDLRQLAQRITARFHLPSLDAAQTRAYIRHRLVVAGGNAGLFGTTACRRVHRLTGGVPRLVNTVCDRALMGAYSLGRDEVTTAMVQRAARESLADEPSRIWQVRPAYRVAGAAALVIGALCLGIYLGVNRPAATESTDIVSDAPETGSAEEPAETAASAEIVTPQVVTPPEDAPVTIVVPESSSDSETPAPPPAPDVAEVDALPDQGADLAQLRRMWGIFEDSAPPCEAFPADGLRCLSDQATLDELREFNLPALLTLRDGDQIRDIILSGVGDDDTVRIVTADGQQTWSRETLLSFWTGEFTLLWRLEAPTRRVSRGSVGPGVVWVRRRLAIADGVNPDNRAGRPSPIFDQELETQVREFQLRQGVTPDGIVGARTMILLNNLEPAPNTPGLGVATGRD
ncbi:AAA family ATPase [Salinisphaera sp. P385]|uniref:AAA family ATPase n=1 Tax=Spectribacter acetivorans TaxID=3075603 RepID=A0ABU3B860_9GAMM|nr:AAA family ATPase [Salinisphaera sp. P385]MDT0618664.1 AAA family ATPase [Salinisphaera sp. P385]